MKLKVKDLEANPYRRIEKYPIDREKVEDLKSTIQTTFYWPGQLMARKHNGKYQLAFGHHRLIALKELGIKEIEVSICEMDDATMLKAMADENMRVKQSPAVMIQTVLAAKEFLDGKLKKCQTISQFNKSIKLVETESQFQKLKQTNVGQTTILKFLESRWWKQWMVQGALSTIAGEKEGTIDREAVEVLPNMEQANKFRSAVKIYKIPKSKQKQIAKQAVKEGVGSRDIPDLVAEHSVLPVKKELAKPKPLPNLIEFLNKCESDTDYLNRRLKALHPHLKELIKKKSVLGRLVSALKQLDKTAEKIITEYEAEKKRKESVICAGR